MPLENAIVAETLFFHEYAERACLVILGIAAALE
jgi:hypothetical protein